MSDVVLYAVNAAGAKELDLPYEPSSLYDLPEDLALGVYTSLRTFDHYKFLRLSDHLLRLEQSMALLGWRYTLDEETLRPALHQVCVAYPHPEARVRIDVLARPAAQLGSDSRVLLTLAPFESP
ncbi:MAG TPA: aminotransferase class IV, partial [Candidatus Binatia bacterium]|nr:aminotransferase class IV [Candidatus Binatia bacterium]